MTFDKWWEEIDGGVMVREFPKKCCRNAWNHQQEKISGAWDFQQEKVDNLNLDKDRMRKDIQRVVAENRGLKGDIEKLREHLQYYFNKFPTAE